MGIRKRPVITCMVFVLAMGIMPLSACTQRDVKDLSALPAEPDTAATPNNDVDQKSNDLEILKQNNFTVFEEQSFWVNLKNWGKVRLISGCYEVDGIRILTVYLMDENQNILYQLPELIDDTSWNLYEVTQITFSDVNQDGLEDIEVIAQYMTGAGPSGATPFPVAGVYYQKDKAFIWELRSEEEIN